MGKTDEPKVGEELPDGRIYAGRSPETNEKLFINRDGLLESAGRTTMNFAEAKVAIDNLAPHGWRLSTKKESIRTAACAAPHPARLSINELWEMTRADVRSGNVYEGKVAMEKVN